MIIFPENIRKVRPIADNINDEKRLLPYIEEVERLYLIPALTPEIYAEIIADRTPFETLFCGGFYDNNKKFFSGLNDASGYLIYSRFVLNNQANVTAFGVQFKNGEFSERADEKTLIRISKDAEKIGLQFLDDCVEYLKFIEKIECANTMENVIRKKFIAI